MLLFNFLKYAYFNKRNLSLNGAQIKKLQYSRFLKLVQYASRHSLYYQQIIKEHDINIYDCKPEDFPVLTKLKLIEAFDTIVTDQRITKEKLATFLENSHNPQDLFLNQYYVIHTSGTSGIVGYFVYSQVEFVQGISLSSRASNLKIGQTLAFVGATKGHFAGITMITTGQKLPLLYKEVQTYDINQPFDEIIDKINLMKPSMLGGYPFALKKLAEAQKTGKLFIKPRVLQSGGEAMSLSDKAYIQEVFQAPIVNIYASSEHLIMGISRDTFGGMYLMEDNLYFELSQNGMHVTNLFNYTLPLIRYQMSDHLKIIDDLSGAMPFLKSEEIIGRKEHNPVFINDNGVEDFISSAIFVEFYIRNLSKFQVHLLDHNHFIFKVCLEPNISKEEVEAALRTIEYELKKILNEKKMSKVQFRIEIVSELWVDKKTGKFKMITQ